MSSGAFFDLLLANRARLQTVLDLEEPTNRPRPSRRLTSGSRTHSQYVTGQSTLGVYETTVTVTDDDFSTSVHVLFLWLESADLAVNRVAARVRLGGHDVPEATVRRRYTRGLRNFFDIYLPLADSWHVFDNSRAGRPQLVASGHRDRAEQIADAPLW